MQPGVVKAATDEGNGGERIKITEHSDAIDENDLTVCVRLAETIELQPLTRRPALDGLEMRGRRFVGRDDEAKAGDRMARGDVRWQQRCFIRGPGRSGDDRQARARESGQQGALSIDV